MNSFGIMILAIAVIAIASLAGTFVARSKIYQSLKDLIARGDTDTFFKKVDSGPVRALLTPYGREYLRFEAIALTSDRGSMVEQFNQLMKFKLSTLDRSTLLSMGFTCFAAVGDKKHCKRVLDAMNAAYFDETSRTAYKRHYDIIFGQKTSTVKELENKRSTLRGTRLAYVEYLLSVMYANLHDRRASDLRHLSAEHYGVPVTKLERSVRVVTTF